MGHGDKAEGVREAGVVEAAVARFGGGLPDGVTGIGDDCAVFPGAEGMLELVSTDLLIQDVHFRMEAISPADLGYKALAVNLSDIAAMGGVPHSAYLSLALPGDHEAGWVEAFLDGVRGLAEATGTMVLGGDTTRSPGPVVINVAVIGRAEQGRVKYRDGARAGDALCVTGVLGDSAAGLRLQENGEADQGEDEARLIEAHHRPRPHLEEGRWLAARAGVTAMMDLSDGLAQDLGRLCERSGVGARVELEALPISNQLERVGAERGWDVQRLAAVGGEDYCLLCAVEVDAIDEVRRELQAELGQALWRVGEVGRAPGGVSFWSAVGRVELQGEGFSHF